MKHRCIHPGRLAWHLSIAVVAACTRQVPQQPAPPFNGAVILEIPIDSIRAYAGRLRFDSLPPGAHEARVDFARARLGGDNVARIEPAFNLCTIDSVALASGRLVARIRTERSYPPLGPVWTYVWMDRFGLGNSWRVVLLAPEARVVRPALWDEHDSVPSAPQAARFREATAGDTFSVKTCYCCTYGWCGMVLATASGTMTPRRPR